MTNSPKRKKYGRSRSWAVDSVADYAHKLNPEEKQWLEQFSDEYYRNRFYFKSNTNPIITRDIAQERAREHYRLAKDVQNTAGGPEPMYTLESRSGSPEDILLAVEELELFRAEKKERRRVRHNETRRESRRRKKQ